MLASVSVTALTVAAASLMAPSAVLAGDFNSKYTAAGAYMSGDFHNHTTCADGAVSVKTLATQSMVNLDWFVHTDHGGAYPRDCRFDDFAYDGPDDGQGKLWEDTVGKAAIKGDPAPTTTSNTGHNANGTVRSAQQMWRWQSLQEYQFPDLIERRNALQQPIMAGMEWVVPAHEHTSTAIITGQYAAVPNVNGQAQFEYCFAVNSDDTSGGGGQGWTCEITNADNDKLRTRFGAGKSDQGTGDYNSTLGTKGINIADNGEHVKSTAAVYWMQEKHAGAAYAVPAHLERAGAFVPGQNRGYNIEHLRDWNNAAPDVAFGFESQPGHQAASNRGEYSADRSPNGSAGQFTYGGTGCYAAAESAKPGYDFDGKALTAADFGPNGRFAGIPSNANPTGVTLCKPGVRTMWDAMLSEGRHYWFFASSDWHNRGNFAPFDKYSTQDFWPGEYQKNWTFVRKTSAGPAQDIVNGLRSGNNFVAMGGLIDDMSFKACTANACATMGETLTVNSGADVTVTIAVHDPNGTNLSPYSFNNPALLQLGIKQPINKPMVAQIDLIQGDVHAPYTASANPDAYKDPLAPATTKIAKSWNFPVKAASEWKTVTYVIRSVTANKYIRVRGSNLPAGTPNKRDADGNPLRDDIGSNNIKCSDPACPAHVNGKFEADIEGWSDLSFFANPIFIQIKGSAS
ncbi:hypothetical protein [Rhodomicrobium vannielii]|nr:hypothetical protein [Rhodomicrobium vannielii]